MAGIFKGFGKNKDKKEREKQIQENALNRPDDEVIFRKKPDRIGKYLVRYLDNFVFGEFSDSYLESQGIADFMTDVPIPLRKEDIEEFNSEKGLAILHLAENMAWIMGIDPKFRYTEKYIQYMEHYFKNKAKDPLVKEGKDAGEKDDLDDACIHFRAALCFEPIDLSAMYGYARVCRKMYLDSDDPIFVGDHKAEALNYFELITEIHPKFAQAFYYLGYMYLNMGLYAKAYLTWETFVDKSMNSKDVKEIKKRMEQIKIPMEVEKGYNAVLANRWNDGIQILEPFLDSEYKDWWPLSYYLGVAYICTGSRDEAVSMFERVLKLNPSHVETMDELVGIYEAEGKKDMAKKYRDKATLIRGGGYEEDDELPYEEYYEEESNDSELITEELLEKRKLDN